MPPPRALPRLKRPGGGTAKEARYSVHAANKGVERGWRDLEVQYRSKLRFFHDYLSQTPLRRYKDRVLLLRGKQEGIWECEVGGGARILYVVDGARGMVIIRWARVADP